MLGNGWHLNFILVVWPVMIGRGTKKIYQMLHLAHLLYWIFELSKLFFYYVLRPLLESHNLHGTIDWVRAILEGVNW